LHLFNRRGLTFIEILIVIAIIGIIAAILYPVIVNSRRTAYQSSCSERLRHIYMALELYGADHPNFTPLHESVRLPNEALQRPYYLLPYLKTNSSLYCPETPNCARRKIVSTYVWNAQPSSTSPIYSSAIEQIDERYRDPARGYPVVHCLVHDELHYFPSERHLSERLNPPFVIRLLPTGSVRKGRFAITRGHDIARLCRME
jgi:prepilin-type N-terminal cleavage/methylation domain-containing protein